MWISSIFNNQIDATCIGKRLMLFIASLSRFIRHNLGIHWISMRSIWLSSTKLFLLWVSLAWMIAINVGSDLWLVACMMRLGSNALALRFWRWVGLRLVIELWDVIDEASSLRALLRGDSAVVCFGSWPEGVEFDWGGVRYWLMLMGLASFRLVLKDLRLEV